MDALRDPCGLSPEQIRRCNNQVMRLFSLYLNLMPGAVDADAIRSIADECRLPFSEAYAQFLAASAGFDAAGEDRAFYDFWLKPAMRLLDPAPFYADPYFAVVGAAAGTHGKWQLKQEKLAPFEAFVCGDPVVTQDRRMIPQIGFFKEPYAYPAMLENGREWMTLLPNETVTTAPAIGAATGRVLTYGLGLGYFAYHASEKSDVASVTVVDISPDVIELFRTHLLPRFPHGEKITLVCEDAFKFAETRMAGNFDFVFADIWHDAGDGRDLYLKMLPWRDRFPDIRFAFWLEDTLRCYLDPTLW